MVIISQFHIEMIIAKILLIDHVYLMKWINSRRFRIFIKADNKEIHSKFKIPNLGIDDFCIDLYFIVLYKKIFFK